MERAVLGWPPDGPRLRLDWRRFSYAGKFVATNTGKAVLRDGPPGDGEFADEVLAAVAFNEDRTDPGALWLRYVTVAADRRGEGLGPALCAFVTDRAFDRGYDRVRIAVNNPFAYEALHKVGFAFTGRETGIAELVLEHPADGRQDGRTGSEGPTDPDDWTEGRYRDGLDRFRDRDLSAAEREFLDSRDGPPAPSHDPSGG